MPRPAEVVLDAHTESSKNSRAFVMQRHATHWFRSSVHLCSSTVYPNSDRALKNEWIQRRVLATMVDVLTHHVSMS